MNSPRLFLASLVSLPGMRFQALYIFMQAGSSILTSDKPERNKPVRILRQKGGCMRRGDNGCCGCCCLILIPLGLLFMLLGGC